MTLPAYQADGAPVARETFYAIACDPQRSVVVEACAGAGKTWMLVSRILRALLSGAEPHEMLAITFTRKAAGEMRQRLNDWLREFAAPGTSDAARIEALVQRGVPVAQALAQASALAGLHERLLHSGRSVEIRTFHAWFSQLLRAAPLDLLAELGLQPDMELIEDLEDHRAEVFRRFHASVLQRPERRADHALLTAQRGRSQVRKWFEAAWNKRVEFELADEAGVLESSVPSAGEMEPVYAGMATPAERLRAPEVRALLLRVAAALGAQTQLRPAKQGGLLEQALALDDDLASLAAARHALLTKGALRKGLDVPELADAVAVLDHIQRACEQQACHEEHGRMLRLSRLLLAEFAAYKRARGLADMADLERGGLALLRDAELSGWVQERLDARIRHVLIDEFQDTSPLQWHALYSWLSAYAGAGGGASGQRPPGVFIVGDPKQSIYRFRRADPRVFDAARAFVVDALGGQTLACDHTRRNAPEVLEIINTVFAEASRANEFGGFRAHTTELRPVSGAGGRCLPRVLRPGYVATGAAADITAWRDSLTTPRREPEVLPREQEAASVATAVQTLITQDGVAPGDIFVLCRKRQSLRLVAQAFRALHLPCAAVEDAELMEAPEARDLVALLDVLVSPQHRLSLAHALRSPVFGASDDDLVALALHAEQSTGGDWWAALVGSTWGDDDGTNRGGHRAALHRAAELLPRWQAAARALPPHDLLDRIVAEGELHARVAATVPAEQRMAAHDAIDAVLAQALMLDGARYATPYNFVRALKRRSLKASAPAQPGAVQLLTVHGAKGLEARVVFVMDCDPEPAATETTTLLVDWPVDAERPLRCAFVYAESLCPPSLAALLARENQARRREELNGLYVAMSRAKERLVFSATAPHRPAGTRSWWQRVEALAPAWEPAAAEGRSTRTHSHTDGGRLAALSLKQLPGGLSVPAAAPIAARSAETEATRLGKAVHRVLEWATATPLPTDDLSTLAEAASREFGAPAAAAARLAERILQSPETARFFTRSCLRWAGNEVPVTDAGELLRIDRLVQLDDGAGPVWWVLDYKLQHEPQALASDRAQLLRYRNAVQGLQPGAVVRCAFLTGEGAVVEVV